jgi:hypothetical protein
MLPAEKKGIDFQTGSPQPSGYVKGPAFLKEIEY